jgi:hypothetical protein
MSQEFSETLIPSRLSFQKISPNYPTNLFALGDTEAQRLSQRRQEILLASAANEVEISIFIS